MTRPLEPLFMTRADAHECLRSARCSSCLLWSVARRSVSIQTRLLVAWRCAAQGGASREHWRARSHEDRGGLPVVLCSPLPALARRLMARSFGRIVRTRRRCGWSNKARELAERCMRRRWLPVWPLRCLARVAQGWGRAWSLVWRWRPRGDSCPPRRSSLDLQGR